MDRISDTELEELREALPKTAIPRPDYGSPAP